MGNNLLQEVKDYLTISWEDEKTDNKLRSIIKRGMARLTKIAGVPSLDFEADELPKQLLLDYCRYANSHALEVFEKNFRTELMDLHYECQIAGDESEN